MCVCVHRIDVCAAGKAGEMPQFRFPTCAASWLSSRVGFSCLASYRQAECARQWRRAPSPSGPV